MKTSSVQPVRPLAIVTSTATVRRIAGATIVGAMLALSAGTHARELPTATLKLDIAAQPIGDALLEFSRQAGIQVVFDSKAGQGISAPRVAGQFTAAAALTKLLANTGLQFEYLNDRTVAVRPVGESADASAAASMSALRVSQVDSAMAQVGSNGAQSGQDEQTTDGSQSTSAGEALDEVVVTAQKRTERLIEVPQAVTVLSADSLARIGATQFRDFANSVPGLAFSTAGAGNTRVVLRGVTTGYDVASTVGIYVDEVPFGSSSAFTSSDRFALDVGLFDLERIEVLRGPQGTLYGASSMGGLIKYVTRQPDAMDLSGAVQTDVAGVQGGSVNYNVAAMINAPLVADKVALRVSGFEAHEGGFIDNLSLGRKDVNESDVYGGRADLLFTPTEALSVRLTGFVQNIKRDGEATSDYTLGGDPIDDSLEQRRVLEEPFRQKFRLGSATLSYDLGAVKLSSISSYQTSHTNDFWDVSPGYVPIFSSIGLFYSAVGAANERTTDKFTQEVRVVADRSGAFEWVLGGFYTHEDSTSEQNIVLRDLAGNPAPGIFPTSSPSRYEEYAAFGDLTYYFSDRFDVTAGMRYARNDQIHWNVTDFTTGARSEGQASESVSTYLANVRYRLSERSTLYARYATGYRPGGPNFPVTDPTTGLPFAVAPFGADRLKSYELGFKGETRSRRVGIDLAVYSIDWSNMQTLVVRGGFGGLANAPGGARSRGAELALTLRPVHELSVTGAFAYQDAHMLAANADLGSAEGERLPNVPRFTAHVSADYSFAGNLQPTVGMTYLRVSDRHASFDQTLGFLQYYIPAYSSFDLRAGLQLGRVSTQLYLRNVFDKRGQVSALNTWQGLARPAILQPRTLGISATTRF